MFKITKFQEQINPTKQLWVDPIVKEQLDRVKYRVLKKDHDWVACIDGEEGCGKSVLGMQLCTYLDPNFTINKIVFNAEQLIDIIKSPTTEKGSAILLDEAYSAINARAAMTEVNRSVIAVATEMRQRNLFVIVVLPSYFDLDRTIAIHRTKALFHVYLDAEFNRGQYIIFPKDVKRELYHIGKKKYSYAYPYSPYPPCRFFNYYPVNEMVYREKKAEVFRKRTVNNRAREWYVQRNAYIKFILKSLSLTADEIAKLPAQYGGKAISSRQIHQIVGELGN
jgi:ABC-type dipeptide/oligopeptide/nickel transport system ATPase component